MLCLVLSVAGLSPAQAAEPAIARPVLHGGNPTLGSARGLVFLLAVEPAPGVAAVGTAHTLTLEEIAHSGQVDFRLGETERVIATSRRFLTRPGQPFGSPGSALRRDFMVFALDAAPAGLRVLEAAPGLPELGQRVRILGIPGHAKRHQQERYGRIERADSERIEIALDVPHTLEGWGGAPVLERDGDRVLGIVETQVSRGGITRAIAAPLGALREALKEPLGGGRGEAFAAFASPGKRAGHAHRESPEAILGLRAPHPPATPAREVAGPPGVSLQIDFPAQGARLTNAGCGVFVSGRASALAPEIRPFDVVMVIDTSASTREPSGADIDGDGRIGRGPFTGIDFLFLSLGGDPGDSILAAEVAAARQLMQRLDPRHSRIGLVGFSGGAGGRGFRRSPAAYTLEPLTRDYRRVERALEILLEDPPEGSTHMAAGLDRATTELRGLRGADSRADPRAEKIVLFFTDGQPTLPHGPDAVMANVRAVLRAADRAQRAGVRVHSFAIGPEALEGPIAAVEMARRTRGSFTPVRAPGDLVQASEDLELASIEEVMLWNETRGEGARLFRLGRDGSWAGLVELDPGPNRLRVRARSTGSEEVERFLDLHYTPEAPPASMPDEFAVSYNRLLEDCLQQTRGLHVEAERERAEQIRRKLRLEIETERERARQRVEEQRKQLELQAERAFHTPG